MRSITTRNAVTNAVTNGTPTLPNPTRPDPTYMSCGSPWSLGDGDQASNVTDVTREPEPFDDWRLDAHA